MNTLLADWRAFCEGMTVLDKSHFLGLLKAHNSHEELRQIFGYFPLTEDLVDRAERVISSGRMEDSLYLLPAHEGEKNELIKLGSEWLKEQERVSRALGEDDIFNICHNAQVRFVSKHDLEHSLQEDIPHHWLFEATGDAIRSNRVSDSKQTYALFEALYGLAADYYLAWYIGRPLFKFEINLEPYFMLWQAGGKCALTEKALLVSN